MVALHFVSLLLPNKTWLLFECAAVTLSPSCSSLFAHRRLTFKSRLTMLNFASFFIFSIVVLRPILQQSVGDLRVQKRRPVRHQQEEPDVVQGLPPPQVPAGGHVQERLPLRPPLQLVQIALPHAGARARLFCLRLVVVAQLQRKQQ